MRVIKNIGILGGTFNPPHFGHLKMAECAIANLKLDKLLFIPNGNPPHKNGNQILNSADRLNMTKLLVLGLEKTEVSDIEIGQAINYTADTLTKLKTIYSLDRLFFLLGADSLDYIDKWMRPEIIFQKATVAVFCRSGIAQKEVLEKIKILKRKYNALIEIIDMEPVNISSSEIREAVKMQKNIEGMTTENVIKYIYKNNIYANR